jgi:hypothetical protein
MAILYIRDYSTARNHETNNIWLLKQAKNLIEFFENFRGGSKKFQKIFVFVFFPSQNIIKMIFSKKYEKIFSVERVISRT